MRFLVLIPLVLSIVCCEPIPKKPNVVFILVDDLGWSDLGYMGSTFYETPQLDKFSKQSVNFTNAYASGSVCSPSRAAIMTGKHPVRLQITDWIPGMGSDGKALNTPGIANQLSLDEVTLAERLRQNGYKTFFAGKWHLGDSSYFPEDQGFDINIGGHDKGSPPGGYYAPYKNPKLDDGPEGEYLTDRLTDESLQFLDNVGEDPFMLYLSFYTVHTPIQANKEYIGKFEEKLGNLENKESKTRAEGAGITRLDQNNPAYASMVYAMDQNVGRLIQKLKDRGLYEHTIIVFTSDNGGLSTLDKNRNNPAPTSVLPLRGGKGWLYEGGIRVPLLYKPLYHKSGKVVDTPVIGHDFFPTILSQMGLALPEDLSGDGIDFSRALTHPEEMPERDLVWHYPHYHGSGWAPGSAIRSGKWKLIEFYETGKVELYDLKEDIAESNDIAELLPKKTEALRELLHAQLDSMNAAYTTPAN